MNFIIYLVRNNKLLIVAAALIGVVSGGANAMLISLVNKKLTSVQPQPGAFSYFLLVGLVAFVFGILSQFLMIFLSQRLTFRLRLKLCYQILGMPYRSFEETGSAKLVASFTNDILTVAGTLLAIPTFIVNAAITLGCLVYLGFLSPIALAFLVLFIVLATASYLLPERLAIRYLARNREAWDRLFGEFNAMNQGAKELKLHYRRRKEFFTRLLRVSADEVRSTGNVHRVIYTIINQWGSLLYFVFMGILLFVVPQYQELDTKTMTGYVLISLYLAAPVSGLIGFMPNIRAANVAFAKIRALGLDMLGTYSEPGFPDRSEADEPLPPLKSLNLKGVTHTFYREKEDGNFTLGPIDLTIEAGQLVFIIGGNGSGKTTLAKLLTGLYSPESGEIFVNGEPVGERRDRYRQYFSAIFDNFYIFEQLLGMEVTELDERALGYLKQLNLEHKVEIKDGRLSTTQLSTGQRKRLALLTAYLEDRQIYVFDEWAADQDPEFKTVFYHQILPELKARGKTVFVISHDDRYFQVADRIDKLTDGQLEKSSDGQPT